MPVPFIMEQLSGARRTMAVKHRVNREEQCKQRWDNGSYFPGTLKGGKHPRVIERGVVDTGIHKLRTQVWNISVFIVKERNMLCAFILRIHVL